MNFKQVLITLVVLNIIFFGFFYVISQTTLFDYWKTNKNSPDLCTQEASDGGKIFTFCPAAPTE